jgi:hypothetical protein
MMILMQGHRSPAPRPRPAKPSPQVTRAARIYDVLVALCVAIWLGGGIPWGDRMLLHHGADPRRAALIVGFLGAWFFKRLSPKCFTKAG